MVTENLIFRKATPEDIHALRKCAIICFIKEYAYCMSSPDLVDYINMYYSVEVLLEEIQHPESQYYLVIDPAATITNSLENEELVGYDLIDDGEVCIAFLKLSWGSAQIVPIYKDRLECLEVQRVYVHPEYQNKKIGTHFLEYAEHFAAEFDEGNRFEELWLTCHPGKPKALKFYQRNGYEHTSEYVFPITDHSTTIDYIFTKSFRK